MRKTLVDPKTFRLQLSKSHREMPCWWGKGKQDAVGRTGARKKPTQMLSGELCPPKHTFAFSSSAPVFVNVLENGGVSRRNQVKMEA